MRRHSVAIAFRSNASEMRPAKWLGLSGRDCHSNTSFSSGRGWRGACASKRRDGRDRLLQALVSLLTYRTRSLAPRSRSADSPVPAAAQIKPRIAADLRTWSNSAQVSPMILRRRQTAKPADSAPTMPTTEARPAMASPTALWSRRPACSEIAFESPNKTTITNPRGGALARRSSKLAEGDGKWGDDMASGNSEPTGRERGLSSRAREPRPNQNESVSRAGVACQTNTSFSSGRAWRGACASKRRDGRDRLLQALVVVQTYRT